MTRSLMLVSRAGDPVDLSMDANGGEKVTMLRQHPEDILQITDFPK